METPREFNMDTGWTEADQVLMRRIRRALNWMDEHKQASTRLVYKPLGTPLAVAYRSLSKSFALGVMVRRANGGRI